MYKVIFHVPTLAQAKELAAWYDGQGEQDADIWFEAQDLKAPYVDNQRKGGGHVTKGNTINVYTK